MEAVWEIIGDFDGWSSWNPLYVETSGTLRVGEMIRFAVALDGMKPQKGSATVTAVEPAKLLEYQTRAFGGLVRATRYVEVRQLGPGQCTVANGEHMGGPIGPLVYWMLGEKVRKGLQDMNHALKQLAESGGRPAVS